MPVLIANGVTDLSSFIAMARQQLAPILKCSGKVLYSAADTLSPGRVYILGLNPGGDPEKEVDTIGEALDALPTRRENSYCDELWPGHRARGQAPLQRRVKWLADQIGIDLLSVCASNLVFARSKDARRSGYPGSADKCWPVHLAILEMVQPKLIITFGNSGDSPYAYLRGQFKSGPETTFSSGHGSWVCRMFESEGRRVVGLPHLSRYSPRTEVAARLRHWLEN